MIEIKLSPKETYHLCLKLDSHHILGPCSTCAAIRDKIVNGCLPLIIVGHNDSERQRCPECGRFIRVDSSCSHCPGKEQA